MSRNEAIDRSIQAINKNISCLEQLSRHGMNCLELVEKLTGFLHNHVENIEATIYPDDDDNNSETIKWNSSTLKQNMDEFCDCILGTMPVDDEEIPNRKPTC